MEKRKVTVVHMLYKWEPVLNCKWGKGAQIYATTVRGNILNIKTKKILMVLITSGIFVNRGRKDKFNLFIVIWKQN